MELESFIDMFIGNLENLKKTLNNKNNKNFEDFDKTMKNLFNDIKTNISNEVNKKNEKSDTIISNLEKIKGKNLFLEEELHRMMDIIALFYKYIYKTEIVFDSSIRNYYNLLKNGIRKPVDIGNNNFVNLLNIDNIDDIIDDFTFYYVRNINEVVIRITNLQTNKYLYFNFKLEKIHFNKSDKVKYVELSRLENCRYGKQCNNGNTCKFYHNPIEFNERYHKTRNFYPNFSIKNCPNFGDVELVNEQVIDWIELQNTIQRAGFTILAAACCKINYSK